MTEAEVVASTAGKGEFRRDLAIMALTSCAVLLYEIAITRVLSVVLWYHFVFLAISLAMLALGVPGVWFALRMPSRDLLWKFLLGAGVAIPASLVFIVQWTPRVGLGSIQNPLTQVAWTVVAVFVPLLLLGCGVCFLLLAAPGRGIATMYAADLLGATAGAVVLVPLMWVIPTPILLAGVGFLPLAAAALAAGRRWPLPATAAVLLGLLVLWGQPFQLNFTKTYEETAIGREYERWTPTARLTVFPTVFFQTPDHLDKEKGIEFGWGLGSKFTYRGIEQKWIEQDGSAGTPITRLAGSPAELEHLFFDITSIGYQLRQPHTVGIIGAGGGRDILTALKSGAERVDAVELNPAMIEVANEVFGEFSGHVYDLPGVRKHPEEGRSFLTRSADRFGLLQISLIDSWAATTAGAYALSENYLYTLEAMRLYLNRIEDDGLVSISRWMRGSNQLEAARLVLLAERALEEEGFARPKAHLAAVQGGDIVTLLLARRPFDAEQVARLDAIAEERGFLRHWPLPPAVPPNSQIIEVLLQGPERLEAHGLYLAPPTDDAPFFFQNIRAFTRVDPLLMSRLSLSDQAALLPRFLILSVGLLTLMLFFTPFLFTQVERVPSFWWGSGYFTAIGLGFLWLEIPLIQKFVLYLGHPSYATTVVLSTLLLGTGIGSLIAGRVSWTLLSRARWVLPAAGAGVVLLAPWVIRETLGWAFAPRVILSLMLTAPLGFVLGFGFPTGMIRFGDGSRAWFWALNGAAGVLASVSSVTLAAYWGLPGVAWLGVGCYAAACFFLPWNRPTAS